MGNSCHCQGQLWMRGMWVIRAAWHRSCWSSTNSITPEVNKWCLCASLPWTPCQRSMGVDTLQLWTGSCALPMWRKCVRFTQDAPAQSSGNATPQEEMVCQCFHFDTDLMTGSCRAPCELSDLLPMTLPKPDSLQILKQLILLHLHLHSCSQRNTINSFCRLKLLTFVIVYCNCPSPNILQDTLWVLKTSIQMSVMEECLERKTLQNKLLWGKLNKIPMEVHEKKYCGVQEALSHGAQATGTWMNKEGGDEIRWLRHSGVGWGFLSDVSAIWNTREEPLGSAHTLRFWRHHPQLLLNIQSHGKRF